MHSCFTSFIFSARTLDFTVKFRFVFRYEALVFRRYVLALLSVGLLRKFEAYLVYPSLIWSKNPRCFNSAISLTCCYGFTLSSPVFPRKLMTCAVVFQLCPLVLHCASLLRTIFAPSVRAHERVHVHNVRDFPQTKLDNGINSPFLLREHGDPHIWRGKKVW